MLHDFDALSPKTSCRHPVIGPDLEPPDNPSYKKGVRRETYLLTPYALRLVPFIYTND